MSLTRQETYEIARAQRLAAIHREDARLELRRAAHFASNCPSQVNALIGHAREAGHRAAFAGLSLQDFDSHPALSFPLIREEFEHALHYMRTLLDTPDVER